MAFSLSGAVTGAAITGFTTPTYTVTADTPPSSNSKQWAVTALGGTQTGVTVHSVAAPFTIAAFRPVSFKALGKAHPVTGVVGSVPMNAYKFITRKGVLPLAGQPYRNMQITTIVEIPAGSDLADAPNVKGALSAHIGAVWSQSAGTADTVLSGIL